MFQLLFLLLWFDILGLTGVSVLICSYLCLNWCSFRQSLSYSATENSLKVTQFCGQWFFIVINLVIESNSSQITTSLMTWVGRVGSVADKLLGRLIVAIAEPFGLNLGS